MDSSVPETGKDTTIALMKLGVLPHRSGKGSSMDIERSKIIYTHGSKWIDQLVAV